MNSGNALIIVDVQNDFCPDGSYPVPNGDKIVPLVNQLIAYAHRHKWLVVYSRDWHPPGVNHCVQNTYGAQFHPDLTISKKDIVISKGRDTNNQHFSAFNGDDISLKLLLDDHHIKQIYIVGLALDYCVLYTALDAKKLGFQTKVILDACRALNKRGVSEKEALNKMKNSGINLIFVSDIIRL